MKSFCEKSTDQYLEELKNVSFEEAKSYLCEYGYSSSSFEMPEYYQAEGLMSIELEPIDWKLRNKRVPITSPLTFATPKGELSWRNFNLIHPYIYLQIVSEICHKDSWFQVRDILSRKTNVFSYSTPRFIIEGDETPKTSSVNRWIGMAESDIIKDSVDYNFLTVTDIKNFYPSIYTHSIAWAVNGKEAIKNARSDFELLGNRLDKLFQNAKDGQTNGIPVGSMVSDLAAEIILKDVDVKLSLELEKNDLSEKVLITRYRDDYRVLSGNKEQGKEVLKILSKILDKEYNLALNSDKTKAHADIIDGTFREWSNEINDDYLLRSIRSGSLDSHITSSLFKDILLKIYRMQNKHPGSRSSITLLSKLTDHLNDDFVTIEVDASEVHTVIAILRKLSLIREEASTQVYLLLDILFTHLDVQVKELLMQELYDVIKNKSDNDYQTIWLYRLCLSHGSKLAEDILNDASSCLIDLLKEEYHNCFSHHYEIFGKVKNLSDEDVAELKKFTFVNKKTLDDSQGSIIDRGFYALFSY